jgi:2-dehydropantoate 2-reductase
LNLKKICIYGVGAVGGFMSALLAKCGFEVSAVARGTTRDAIKANGLQLEMDGEVITQSITVSDNPADLGIQDLVIVAVKAQSLPSVAEGIPALIGPQTAVLTAMNGVPWWFVGIRHCFFFGIWNKTLLFWNKTLLFLRRSI